MLRIRVQWVDNGSTEHGGGHGHGDDCNHGTEKSCEKGYCFVIYNRVFDIYGLYALLIIRIFHICRNQ